MKRHLRARIEREFNEVVTPLCAQLKQDGVNAWLDSGTLLGICRDLHPPSWDKDFDLAIWDFDFDKALSSLQYLKQNNPDFLYYTIQVKYLNGKPYAILIIQPGSIPQTFKHLPIAIHIFSKSGNYAVSPQPHSLLALRGAYSRDQLLKNIPLLRRSSDSNLLRWYSPGIILAFQPKLLKYLIALSLVRFSRFSRYFVIIYRKIVQKYRLTSEQQTYIEAGDAGFINNQQSQIVHHLRHFSESALGAWLHEMFVWKIPLQYFESLSSISQLSPSLPDTVLMPSLFDDYLTSRYGDWKVPATDWVYVLQDGCIYKSH